MANTYTQLHIHLVFAVKYRQALIVEKHREEIEEGFGAFSHSKSELEKVIKYIRNQPEHHRKQSFRVEYLALLKRFDVEYKEEYLFEFFDEISAT